MPTPCRFGSFGFSWLSPKGQEYIAAPGALPRAPCGFQLVFVQAERRRRRKAPKSMAQTPRNIVLGSGTAPPDPKPGTADTIPVSFGPLMRNPNWPVSVVAPQP